MLEKARDEASDVIGGINPAMMDLPGELPIFVVFEFSLFFESLILCFVLLQIIFLFNLYKINTLGS